MKCFTPIIFLLLLISIWSPALSQDLIEVEGDILLNSNTPEIRLFDLADNRLEGQLKENNDAIELNSTYGDLRFRTGIAGAISTRLTIVGETGRVGIGTSNPLQLLDVDGEAWIRDDLTIDDADLVLRSENNNTFRIRTANNGDLNFVGDQSETKMVLTDGFGRLGLGPTIPQTKLHITGGSDANSASGGFIQLGESTGLNIALDNNEILARNNGASANLNIQRGGGNLLLCPDELGKVGIGVNSINNIPSGYLLGVDGKVITEEVRVELSSAWPDYVFLDDYQLMPIETLAQKIKEHGHLPGIPSADEIEEGGLHLGDMQRRMMEKIEELSLYIIQQQVAISQLQSDLLSLKANSYEEK